MTTYHDRIFDRESTVGFENLTLVERHYVLIWQLEAEVNNGGLERFIDGSREFAEPTIAALRAVGASNMAKLLNQALAIDKFDKNAIESEELQQLTTQFLDYPDDLRQLVENYIELNLDNLLGPETDLELWNSRKLRGESAPNFVTKNMNFEAEAKQDLKYSSRSCPECSQPVPDYRKTCKKCGFPIGRVYKAQ